MGMLQDIVRSTQRAESRSLCRTQSIIFSEADSVENAGVKDRLYQPGERTKSVSTNPRKRIRWLMYLVQTSRLQRSGIQPGPPGLNALGVTKQALVNTSRLCGNFAMQQAFHRLDYFRLGDHPPGTPKNWGESRLETCIGLFALIDAQLPV
jgi:hypothetical protein